MPAISSPPLGISLIVATVGRTRELGTLLDSLAAQTNRNFELIVVDQNGDERLAPLLAQATQRGFELEHVRLEQRNLSLARNTGFAAGRRAIIAFPDDDCWYEPEVVEHVINAFASDAQLDGLVARWVEHPGTKSQASYLSEARMRHFREVPTSSIALFFRCAALAQAGAFDEKLGVGRWFGGGEEIDLVLRLLRQGARIAYMPQARVHHHFSSWNQASFANARRRARGTGALYAKHALPALVVLRGMIAPLARSALRIHRPGMSANELATALGRVEGYWAWRAGRAEEQHARAHRLDTNTP